jgi:pSer/pThr/pTyr-binding forkhead associated (FHA) protein
MQLLADAAARIERLARASRLNDLDLLLQQGRAERAAEIVAALGQLDPGAYIVGCGPYTQRILRLSTNEIVIGREATISEAGKPIAVDFSVNDCSSFRPREVSRVHARIVRESADGVAVYSISDSGSTCGTFLNGRKIDSCPEPLADLDVISLGPAHVNVVLFLVVPHSPAG